MKLAVSLAACTSSSQAPSTLEAVTPTASALQPSPTSDPFEMLTPAPQVTATPLPGPQAITSGNAVELVHLARLGKGTIQAALFSSPDGFLLAAVGWDDQVVVWSLGSGEQRFTFPGGKVQFSPDGQMAVVVILGEDEVYL